MLSPKRTATLVAIVIASTVVFSAFLYREYQSLRQYMEYIAENGKSALFHEEYINQRIAFTLSTAFSATYPPKAGVDDPATVCKKLEHVKDVYGLNLTDRAFPTLYGTLQTLNPDCTLWAEDVPELSALLSHNENPSPRYSFSNYTGYTFNNIRYYIDFDKHYIYINQLVDSRNYTFKNWLVADNSRISVDARALSIGVGKQALEDLHNGNNVVSHIYKDGYTGKNIISMINPVYQDGKIKGTLITDVDIDDLATSFYTPDRPVLWSFLTLYVEDNNSKEIIQFHKPRFSLFPIIQYQEKITRYYTLNIRLDVQFFVLNTLWLFAVYVITTLLLCRYALQQLNRHAMLAHDNVTDPLTGLFNRKIMPTLESRMQDMLGKNIAVTVIAVDCDGLKRINDTLGHHMGDRAIKLLGDAIAKSVRKSDYGIRLGGDEFNIILIDADLNKAREVIVRIEDKLAELDSSRMVAFSWGAYTMMPQDTFETAFIQADALLYEHKQSKYTPRGK